MQRKLLSGDTDTEMNTRITVVPVVRDMGMRHGADCLVVISAPHSTELGKRYELQDPVVSIGRSRDNDIVLSSDCVSRQHVRIEKRDGDYFGIDLRSTNGTFVNDEAVPFRERRLVPGDLLKVGDTIFSITE
jgi:pSer/pThr/pTyr-binding forkhead associated (FHA) protein